MTASSFSQSYDFESQLELGEMMLNLGRIDEAAIELKKAKDLNEIGAHSTPEGDPQRQADLRRLAQALSRVDELQSGTVGKSRIWSYIAAALLLGLAGIIFFVYALNRNALLEVTAQATADAQLVQAEREQESAVFNQVLGEVTRQAGQISGLYQELGQERYAMTSIAEAGGADEIVVALQQIQDENNELIMTISAAEDAAANQAAVLPVSDSNEEPSSDDNGEAAVILDPTATPAATEPAPTPLSNEELGETISQLRVDAWAANLRQGPGFAYFVIDSLRKGAIVTVIAKSPDSYWYNVETEDGINAWLHSSVAKPLSLDWLPIAETVPAAPFIPPTAVPATPEPPTAVPPTAVPTIALPTPIPEAGSEDEPPTDESSPVEQQPADDGEQASPEEPPAEEAPPEDEPPAEGEEAPAEPPAEDDGGDDGTDTGG